MTCFFKNYFYFILSYFILFYFILIYFILFYLISFYFILSYFIFVLCNVDTIFCFYFNFIFNFIFHSINFILFIFLLCWWLQCKHSCQNFVYFNSISNSISFTSFSIYIFLFNNFISFPLCVVSTTAMWTLMPIFCFNSNFIFNSFSVASFSIFIFY